ncbi:SMP-30/gluconolactonase/LRE family protein [Luteimonas abyssi]|uniref:SMP-30/gluconolactonase/LRE family protein n=1 Tax=Luteimonas abyssi TaxID=1247514 RepID=UPI000A63A247
MASRSLFLASLPLALALAACDTSTGHDDATDARAATADAADGEASSPAREADMFGTVTVYDPALARAVSPEARVERLADGFTWAEGPAWLPHDDSGTLLFTDVPENILYQWTEADGVSVFLQPSGYAGPDTEALREAGANGLFVEPDGTVLLADSGSRELARLDPATRRKTTLVSHYEGRRLNSPNDVVRRDDGQVFFTDPPYGLKDLDDSPVKELAFNGVYRLDPDGGLHLLDDTLSFPNGVALSPDGRTLYVANSDPQRPIWMAYTLDADGNAGERRVFADASDLMGDDAPGLPDGLAVAADGTLFATGPGGVIVFAADGTRLGRIETGGPIANCTFGDDGRTLYLAANDMLARIRVEVPGLGFAR